MKTTRTFLFALVLAVAACEDRSQPLASPTPPEPDASSRGGLMISASYGDEEAAVHVLWNTENRLADPSWIASQAELRDVTKDSVRRELVNQRAHIEQYLVKRATDAGASAAAYRRAVERGMERMQTAGGHQFLLPSQPRAESATLALGPASQVCEMGPRFVTENSQVTVDVRGDEVAAVFTAYHQTDREATQNISLRWSHNQDQLPSGLASPTRRQLSICRDFASVAHTVVWDRCEAGSPATATARSVHTTTDVDYRGRTLRTRGSRASGRASFGRRGCGVEGGIDAPPFDADDTCDSGYRAATVGCCDSMVRIDGALWCVVIR